MKTLLLNVTYEPLKVISWKRAVTLLMLGKVEVVEEYNDDIRSITIQLKCPAVVRLLRFVKSRRHKIAFCRANVYARDSYTCQYCGKRFSAHELTYDHVLPRSRGGKTCWENIVTSCLPCNDRKGSKTLAEAGLRVLKAPRQPEWLPVVNICLQIKNPPETWQEYLYWFDTVKDGAV